MSKWKIIWCSLDGKGQFENNSALNDRYTQKKLPKIYQLRLLVVVFARYRVMSTCWEGDPVSRPEFLHLRNTWLEFIEKEVMINMYLKIKVTI